MANFGARGPFTQCHRFQSFGRTFECGNFTTNYHVDIRQAVDSVDQILRHGGVERAPRDQGDPSRPAGKENRRLAGGISATNQDNFLVATLHKRIDVKFSSLAPGDDNISGEERLAFIMMVADGVGGTEHGEAASRLAVESVAFWREAQAQSGDALPSQFESASQSTDEEGDPRRRRRSRFPALLKSCWSKPKASASTARW